MTDVFNKIWNYLTHIIPNERGSIEFDREWDLVDCSTLDVSGWTGVTVCGWVYWSDAGTPEHTILSNWDDPRAGVLFRLEPNGNRVEFNLYLVTDGEKAVGGSTTTVPANTWTFVAARYDKSNLEVFVNGTKDDSQTAATNNLIGTPSNDSLMIGASPHNLLNDNFGGEITEVAIWDKALTDSEIINTLYGGGSPVKGVPLTVQSGNLKGYWPMDDGTVDTSADGDEVADESGNEQNGIGDNGVNNTGCMWRADPLEYSQSASSIATPSLASISITANAPTLLISRSVTVISTLAVVSIVPNTPTAKVSESRIVVVSLVSVSVDAKTVTTSASVSSTATTSLVSISITAGSPTVLISESRTAICSLTNVSVVAFAPTVTASTSALVIATSIPISIQAFAPAAVSLVLGQEGFRWRDDNGTEITADWLENQDINLTRPRNVNTRLRTIVNTSNYATANKYQLEYRKVGDVDWKKVSV